MKVLIACEYSGIVRDAFTEKGHLAMSCDLLPTERPGLHYQGDVFDVINDGWDMMIAFPPCTYLSKVSNAFFNIEKYGEKAIERRGKSEAAKVFFRKLWNAPIKKICIENPVGFMNSEIKPRQIIQPYYFGDKEQKTTCLWLKNLSRLNGNPVFKKPEPKYIGKGDRPVYWTEDLLNKITCHVERAKIRSKTFPGIAKAMASQWG